MTQIPEEKLKEWQEVFEKEWNFVSLEKIGSAYVDHAVNMMWEVTKMKNAEIEKLNKQKRVMSERAVKDMEERVNKITALKLEIDQLKAERSQIDVSYRELIELRKENERLKKDIPIPRGFYTDDYDTLKESHGNLLSENEKLRIEKTADQILWQSEIDKLKAENSALLSEGLSLAHRHEQLKAENEKLKDLVKEAIVMSYYERTTTSYIAWQEKAKKEIGG